MKRRTLPAERRRAGWTLLETMVAHGMLALIMTLTALLIAALSRSERNAVRAGVAQQSLARLDELFRRDVHRAVAAELVARPNESPELRLVITPQESVQYFVEQGSLQRTSTGGGPAHHETFRLPHAEWSMELSKHDRPRVILRCRQPADTVTAGSPDAIPRREVRFEAVRSLDRMPEAPAGGGS